MLGHGHTDDGRAVHAHLSYVIGTCRNTARRRERAATIASAPKTVIRRSAWRAVIHDFRILRTIGPVIHDTLATARRLDNSNIAANGRVTLSSSREIMNIDGYRATTVDSQIFQVGT